MEFHGITLTEKTKFSNTNLGDNLNHEDGHKRPQMTSNNLERPRFTSKDSSSNNETVEPKKDKLKAGANIEINHEYLDEFLQISNQ